MINEFDEITELWKLYEDGKAYQDTIGLSDSVPLWTRFYEGDQWAKATDNTKFMPRPVVNITKMICRNKRSNLLSTPVRLVYQTEDGSNAGEKFTHFTEYIEKEIGVKKLDAKAVKDGVVKGTFVYHFYWDADAVGKQGIVEGGVRCEVIDVLNTFVANPKETDEQKQKWIMFASREEVDAVRAMADAGVDKDLIVADDGDMRYDNHQEQDGTKMCTVLTRYFRKNGEVYWEKAVRGTTICKPRPLTPDIDGAINEVKGRKEDVANTSLPDTAEGKPTLYKARLYPVVIGSYEERDKCIYGLSEVANIVSNQRAINNNLAMGLLAVENTSWGKYIVHKNALKGQVITNQPGQVLTDYSDTGNGIKKLSEQTPSSLSVDLAEKIMELTRTVSGATEVMTGEVLGRNQSGTAIAQLQSVASKPIEELRKRFWEAKERCGKVLEQFFKLFYDNKSFSYKTKQFNEETHVRQEVVTKDTFNGAEFQAYDFTVTVEAVGGSTATVASDIAFLDSLLQAGAINPTTYVRLFPEDTISNKSAILEALEEQEGQKLAQAEMMLKQYEAQLVQATELLQKQNAIVQSAQSVISENQSLKAQLISLYNEAKQKINLANNAMAKMGNQYNEVYNDAQALAVDYVNTHGKTETSEED